MRTSQSITSQARIEYHQSVKIGPLSLLKLLLKDLLKSLGISSELANALAELVDGHGLLVEFETEQRLVVEVLLLLDVESSGVLGVELLGDRVLAVVKVLEKVGLV